MSSPEISTNEGIQAEQNGIALYYALLEQIGHSNALPQIDGVDVKAADYTTGITTGVASSCIVTAGVNSCGDDYTATTVIDDDDEDKAELRAENTTITNAASGEMQQDKTINALYQKIFEVQIAADREVGINSQFLEIDGKKVLLRNTSGANESLPPEDYAIIMRQFNAKRMALNYMMAFQRINLSYNLGFDSKQLMDLIGIFDLAVITKESDENVLTLLNQWCNEHVLQNIINAFDQKKYSEHKGPNASLKLFQRITHIVAMEHATVETVTMSRVNGKEILQRETPVTPGPMGTAVLADELSEATIEQKTWFQALSKEDKEIVRIYRPYMLKGDREIPSQCRDFIPGIRNTFRSRVYLVSEGHRPKSILDTIHTGTVVTLVRAKNGVSIPRADVEMQRLTRLNMHLIREALGPDCELHMASLNSDLADIIVSGRKYVGEIVKNSFGALKAKIVSNKSVAQHFRDHIPYYGDDRAIVNNTLLAGLHGQGFASDPKLHTSNIVFNGFRAVSPDDVVGSYAILENATRLVKTLEVHSLAINSTHQLKDWLNELEQLLGQRSDNALKILSKNVMAGDAKDKTFIGKRILQLVCLISGEVNRLVDEHQDILTTSKDRPQKIIHAFGCASGENRTYAALLHASVAAIIEHLIPLQKIHLRSNLNILNDQIVPIGDRKKYLIEAIRKDIVNGFLSPEGHYNVMQCLLIDGKPESQLLSAIETYKHFMSPEALEQTTAKSLAYNYHFQYMIGAQGGVFGGAAIRWKSKDSISDVYKALHPLLCDEIADRKKSVRKNPNLCSATDQLIQKMLNEIQTNLIDPASIYRKKIGKQSLFTINFAGLEMKVPKKIKPYMDDLQALREEFNDYGTYGNFSDQDSLICPFLWSLWLDSETKLLLNESSWSELLPLMQQSVVSTSVPSDDSTADNTWKCPTKTAARRPITFGFLNRSSTPTQTSITPPNITHEDDEDDEDDEDNNDVIYNGYG